MSIKPLRKNLDSKKFEHNGIWSSWLLKLAGFSTIISGAFGLGYQKGMISEMGFGNLGGSYSVQEIFSSAFLGVFYLFGILTEKFDVVDSFWKDIWMFIVLFGLLGLIASFCLRPNYSLLRRRRKTERWVGRFIFGLGESRLKLAMAGVVFGAAVGFVFKVITLSFSYLLMIFLFILLLPSFVGFLSGASYVAAERLKDECIETNDELLKESFKNKGYVPGCTKIVIDGRAISGEIMLENQGGIFLKRNRFFLYASKDGRRCIYQRYYLEKDEEKQELAKKPKNEVGDEGSLEEFCQVSSAKKT